MTAFDEARGLGRVTIEDGATDGGTSMPFHCIEIADGTRTIEVGTRVRFDVLAKLGRYEARALRQA